MPEYDDEMTGVLFPNREKRSDKSPDFTGKCQIDGKELRLAAWKREAKSSGTPFLSIKITDEEEQKRFAEEAADALDM